MLASPKNALCLAGSAACVVAASLLYTKGGAKKSVGATEITVFESNNEDFITEELVVKIFDRLFLEMQMVLQQLSHQINELQKAGQMIPPAQLRQVLTSEYERALMDRQSKVFDEHDVDADCIEEATWEFLKEEEKYPKAKASVDRFQKLYESVSGETGVSGRRPGKTIKMDVKIVSASETIEAAKVYFGQLTKEMKALGDKFKAEGRNLHDPAVQQELQMKFAALANTAGEDALKTKGLTTSDFQASIEKHSADPKVARTLQMLQMQQQQEIAGILG